MSLLETPRASISFYTPGGTLSALASEIRVIQGVTEEIYSAELKIDYKWLSDQEATGKTIEIGQTLDIYLTRGTDPWTQIFSGRVWTIRKEFEGHEPRWFEVGAKGWGKYLQDEYIGYISTLDTITNVLQWLVQPLINDGRLTGTSIASSTVEVNFDHSQDWISRWDGIAEITGELDWDFYVDNSRYFHAFPRGSRVSSESFQDQILSTSYVLDGEKIINVQRVIGAGNKTLGSDSEYTESPLNWASNGGVFARRNKSGDQVIDPDPKIGAGDYVISGEVSDATGGIYLERTFSPALDLSMFGTLKFAFKYYFSRWASWFNIGPLTLKIIFYTDSANYWEYEISFPGSKIDRLELAFGWKWTWGWIPVELNFNLKAGPPPTKIGDPTWERISKIRFNVVGPLPGSSHPEATLMIDNMRFEGGFFYSFRYDSTSRDLYGERRGPLIYRPSLTSDERCAALADRILDAYKDPIPVFEKLEVQKLVETDPGYQVTISVAEIEDVPVVIRSKEISLSNYDLRTFLDLAKVKVPEFEQLIEQLSKKVEDLVEERLPDEVVPAAIAGFITSPLGEDDVNISASQDNLVRNAQFEIDINLDGIPDAWIPSDKERAYRTSDEARFGQFSARIPEGCTLESALFPIDRSGGYFGELWSLGWDGTNIGTHSAYFVLYTSGPDPSPNKTFTICENVSPTSWERHQVLVDGSAMPVDTSWGRIRLVGEKGTANYFDDILVQRLIGVDSGKNFYERAVSWSTSSSTPQLVWSDTWDPSQMNIKYVPTLIGADLRSSGGDGFAALRVYLKANDVIKDTLIWTTLETAWKRFLKKGSLDITDFGETLTVEFYIWTEETVGDIANMRNPEVWINVTSIKERIRHPIDGEPV